MSLAKKRAILSDVLPKIRTFCNYRDRCHKEVKDKLYQLGLWQKDVEQALTQMIEEGLLNEERYARSYARGHFNNKKWGRLKITAELKSRQVNDRLIRLALSEIDDQDYQKEIVNLITKKLRELKGSKLSKRDKVSRYLLQKGYQYSEFNAALEQKLQ